MCGSRERWVCICISYKEHQYNERCDTYKWLSGEVVLGGGGGGGVVNYLLLLMVPVAHEFHEEEIDAEKSASCAKTVWT